VQTGLIGLPKVFAGTGLLSQGLKARKNRQSGRPNGFLGRSSIDGENGWRNERTSAAVGWLGSSRAEGAVAITQWMQPPIRGWSAECGA